MWLDERKFCCDKVYLRKGYFSSAYCLTKYKPKYVNPDEAWNAWVQALECALLLMWCLNIALILAPCVPAYGGVLCK